MNKLTKVLLVFLRLAIGWHFLFEGLEKVQSFYLGPTETSRPFTSEGYLREATGPMGRVFRQRVGDPDKDALDMLTVAPETAGQAPHERMPPGLKKAWDDYFQRFVAYYQLNPQQRASAEAKLNEVEDQAVQWLLSGTKEVKKTYPIGPVQAYPKGVASITETTAQQIQDYRDKLQEIHDMQAKVLPAFGRDVEGQKLRDAKADAARMRTELLNDLDTYNVQMKASLKNILPNDQQAKDPMQEPKVESEISRIDMITMWGLVVVGACLLLGLFTRTACLGAAAFLLMLYLSVPPWPWLPENLHAEGHYLFVDKNLIEMLAALTLATTQSGRCLGIDGLLQFLNPWRWRRRPVTQPHPARMRPFVKLYPQHRTPRPGGIHNMALDLTPEQKQIGQDNFHRVVGQYGVTRRDFMKGLLAAGAVLPITAAAYYGYKKMEGNPVKVGLIGAGDEGGVLVGEHNPEYLEFIAYSDIRPYNQKRIFTGEPTGPRKGFTRIYGADAEKRIKKYENYKELLENKDIEAVVIALPLHLHAPVVMDAMKAGKHVLCEKLMAWNINLCKKMIKVSDDTERILTIGHQRHYSMLYAHAVEVLESGILGDVKYIRALWHRNNSWPLLDKDGKPQIDPATHTPMLRDSWCPEIRPEDRDALQNRLQDLDFKSMEELVRWRLYNRTGAGLMAELGSHQLDASSIFLGHVHPLAVSGVGVKSFYRDDREVDDHVFTTFEFPGKNYYADVEHKVVNDPNDVVVLTYSSINTNSFEPYGEWVMGTHGTMSIEMEQTTMLFMERDPNKPAGTGGRGVSVTVSSTEGAKPALEASGSSGPAETKAVDTGDASIGAPVSHGYREEMEHFAYCIQMYKKAKTTEEKQKWMREPRCHGRIAMADAIIALTSNEAMKRHERIQFDPKWFEAESPEVPDADMKPTNAKGEPIDI